jgi:PIN domain nuclease of toxin-antitoxin system
MGGDLLIVIDTHAWLWWIGKSTALSESASAIIEADEEIGVAAISCWEVAMLAADDRLQLGRPASDWLQRATAVEGVVLLALTPAVAVRAVELRASVHDPADCLIAATAMEHGVPLVTADRRLQSIPGLRTIW